MSSSAALGYRCTVCRRDYSFDEATYTCPADGGNLDVLLDYEAISRASSPKAIGESRDESIWRYLSLLPVEDPGLHGTALARSLKEAVGFRPSSFSQRRRRPSSAARRGGERRGVHPTARSAVPCRPGSSTGRRDR